MAAPFNLTGWTWLRVTGADAAKFLQNFCTNDLLKAVASDGPGGCEAFFTSEKARVLGHGWLVKTGDGVDVFGTPGQGPALIAHLSKYALTEDVAFGDRTGEPLVFVPAGHTDGLPSGDLLGAGEFLIEVPADVVPLTEPARIAAKLPRHGVDLTDAHLAPEADRPWAISYAKGCYLGQEPIARIRALGRVNKLLRGLRFESAAFVPDAGATVTADGADAGAVTSAAGGLALAFVKRKWAEPGTVVTVNDAAAIVF